MEILGTPLGYVMFGIDFFVHNYGFSLVLFVIFTKVVLFPLAIKQQKSTARMASMSGKQKELQKKYGTDKQKLNEAMMKMYEEEGYNPMGGCLPMIVQMVLLFGIIDVIYKPLTHLLHVPKDIITAATTAVTAIADKASSTPQIDIIAKVQSGVPEVLTAVTPEWATKIGDFNMNFLGVNMGEIPTWTSVLVMIPIISCLTALLSTIISMRIQKKNGQEMQGAMKYTMLFMPLMSLWIGFSMPAGAGIYWILSNVLMVAQQVLVQKLWPPEKVALMTDKSSEKTKEKMRKKREKMEAYNKMLEEKGMAPKPIPKKIAEPKVIDKEELKKEKEATSQKLADARRRMAEKYGEAYEEDPDIK